MFSCFVEHRGLTPISFTGSNQTPSLLWESNERYGLSSSLKKKKNACGWIIYWNVNWWVVSCSIFSSLLFQECGQASWDANCPPEVVQSTTCQSIHGRPPGKFRKLCIVQGWGWKSISNDWARISCHPRQNGGLRSSLTWFKVYCIIWCFCTLVCRYRFPSSL